MGSLRFKTEAEFQQFMNRRGGWEPDEEPPPQQPRRRGGIVEFVVSALKVALVALLVFILITILAMACTQG